MDLIEEMQNYRGVLNESVSLNESNSECLQCDKVIPVGDKFCCDKCKKEYNEHNDKLSETARDSIAAKNTKRKKEKPEMYCATKNCLYKTDKEFCPKHIKDKKEVSESWNEKMNTKEKDKGKWDGYTLAELKAELAKCKKNPNKTEALKKREHQITFAIRAKQKNKFGKIKEDKDFRGVDKKTKKKDSGPFSKKGKVNEAFEDNDEIEGENNFSEEVQDLRNVYEQMKDLMDTANQTLRQIEHLPGGHLIVARAKSYWYAHIAMALDNEHGYMGSGSVTLTDTIEELEEL